MPESQNKPQPQKNPSQNKPSRKTDDEDKDKTGTRDDEDTDDEEVTQRNPRMPGQGQDQGEVE